MKVGEDVTLDVIRELVAAGVLSGECCPEPTYWHWRALKPELLPEWMRTNYNNYGEIRYYWGE